MTMFDVVIIFCGISAILTTTLAVFFWISPEMGFNQTTHRLEQLPNVMVDRYLFFTFLAIGAAIYADLKVITWLFAGFAFMAFYDAAIYARRGYPYVKHFLAGVLSCIVIVAALLAMKGGIS